MLNTLKYWLPCLGSLLIQMTIFGLHNNFGLVYHYLIKEFNQSAAETAWIGSFAMGLTFLMCPLGNILLSTLGFNVTILISTGLCVTSLVTSSFVNSIHLLTLTYSITFGTGAAVAQQASLLTINQIYRDKLSLANGVTTSGSGLGTLVYGPIMVQLLERFHFRFAFRICALMPLFFLLTIGFRHLVKFDHYIQREEEEDTTSEKNNKQGGGEVLDNDVKRVECYNVAENKVFESDDGLEEETEENEETESKTDPDGGEKSDMSYEKVVPPPPPPPCTNEVPVCKSRFTRILDTAFNRDLWRVKSYVCYILGVSIFLFGYFIPFVFIVEKASRIGIKGQKAQLLLSMLSITSTITKILGGYILDWQKKVRVSTVVIVAMYCMSLSHLIPGFATEYWHLVSFSIIFGICEALFVGQLCAVVTQIVPKVELVGTAISNVFAFMSLSLMLGPVVAGKLSSVLGNLDTSFFIATGISFSGAMVATLLKIFEVKVNEAEVAVEATRVEC